MASKFRSSLAMVALFAMAAALFGSEFGRASSRVSIEMPTAQAEANDLGAWFGAHQRQPALNLEMGHREAQSPLMNYWNACSRDEKLQLLDDVRQMHSPLALPYLAEIAWFTLPSETDPAVAANLFSALGASSNTNVAVAIFVCDFVMLFSNDEALVLHAEACRDALVDRRQRLGR